jgi:hypothetical protein
MCIAMYKKEGMVLTEDTLQNCWDNNPHGAGFMFAENGKLYVHKGFMTFDEFKVAYEPHKHKQCVLHFRIRTHGESNPENTHPFVVDENLALVHNGIISNVVCDINKSMSDTWHFTEKYMKALAPLWRTQAFKNLVEAFIGHSKLIMLNNLGEFEIYSEELGSWDSECWFSNSSYKAAKVYAPHKYVPPRSNEKPKETFSKKGLSVGDRCILNTDVQCKFPAYEGEIICKGTEVKVTYFGHGGMVGISDDINFAAALVPVWQLITELPEPVKCDVVQFKVHTFRFGDEAVVTADHNGLVTGSIVIILNAGKGYCIVEELDSMLEKKYSIPVTLLSPFQQLFH